MQDGARREAMARRGGLASLDGERDIGISSPLTSPRPAGPDSERPMWLRATAIMLTVLAGMLAATGPATAAAQATVLYGVYEAALRSTRVYEDPAGDVEVIVEFASPAGATCSVRAFWDGGDVWRVRFSPTQTSRWRWKCKCSDVSNEGLHGLEGSFECAPCGDRAHAAGGPLRLSQNRRYFVRSDGNPFFWLADTAWNGVLKARNQDWDRFLDTRRRQGFTVVQFVGTHWRAYKEALAFTGEKDVRINPDFFKPLDAKVKAINDRGMVAAPVILWAIVKGDPGIDLSEEDAIRLGRYVVARWGAYDVFWILAGDGSYQGDRAERWRRIGRAVFDEHSHRLATTHPRSRTWWIAAAFSEEPWYSMIGYQSGHYLDSTKWLVQGPPANDWRRSPTLPIVNLEPNYEGITASGAKEPFDPLAVRQALYRSLLVSPTAGVTHGHHAIWQWTEKSEIPPAEHGKRPALSWEQGLAAEGGKSVQHLARLFGSIKWWTLAPDPEMVVNPSSDPSLYIASSRSGDGSLALVYVPKGGAVEVNTTGLKRPCRARWFNPSTGRYTPAGKVAADVLKLRTPGRGDWVLVIGG